MITKEHIGKTVSNFLGVRVIVTSVHHRKPTFSGVYEGEDYGSSVFKRSEFRTDEEKEKDRKNIWRALGVNI